MSDKLIREPFRSNGVNVIDALGFTVATVNTLHVSATWKEDERKTYAMAALFAAAPDLLGACECALLWFQGTPDGEAEQALLRAAIAKATGVPDA